MMCAGHESVKRWCDASITVFKIAHKVSIQMRILEFEVDWDRMRGQEAGSANESAEEERGEAAKDVEDLDTGKCPPSCLSPCSVMWLRSPGC